jgi:hypothetical protein
LYKRLTPLPPAAYFLLHNSFRASAICERGSHGVRLVGICLDAKESMQRKNQVLRVKLVAMLLKQYAQNSFTEPLRG